MDEANVPFWAHCESCDVDWIAAYAPMEAAKFAKIAQAHSTCLRCGKPGTVAKQSGGRLTDRIDLAVARRAAERCVLTQPVAGATIHPRNMILMMADEIEALRGLRPSPKETSGNG